MSTVSIKDKLKEKIKERQNVDRSKNVKKDPLFDNPMFQNMKKSLPESEQKKYDEYGEHMYSNITDNGDVSNSFNESGEFNAAVDTVSQIKVMLSSGMHPSYLSKEEKEFLSNYLGKEWYLEFGYLENDLNRINM
jgi:hypothetical protein